MRITATIATIAARVAAAFAVLLAAAPAAWAQYAGDQAAGGQVRETIPAGPYLAGAYAFIWAAVLVYVISVARRLRQVQSDLEELRGRISRG